jgi:peptide/nickel transport system substrate-binding protein
MPSILRRLAAVFALLALAAGIAACGDDDDAAEGKRGGKLVVINASDFQDLDPGAAYFQFDYMIHLSTQRPLFSYKPDQNSQPATPDLAAGPAEVSSDSKRITVRIRPGVKFGPPVNREVEAKDVKYAIERAFSASVLNQYVGTYFGDLAGAPEAGAGPVKEISGIETPDKRTIVFNFTRPTAGVAAAALVLPASAPVPEEYAAPFDRESPSEYGMNQVATGPYMIENDREGKLTGYQPNRRIHLVRNPNWDKGTDFRPAFLDEIEVREGNQDAAAASRRILEGESMIAGDFSPPGSSLKLATGDRFEDQLDLTPAGGFRYVPLNTTKPPFDDLNIRKAVLAGFDRRALRQARGGPLLGDVATHFIPTDFPGFEEAGGPEGAGVDYLAKPEGDMGVAAKYFRAAGMESGRYEGDEEILVLGEDVDPGKTVALVAHDQFRRLGFKAKLQMINFDAMNAKCGVPEEQPEVCPNFAWAKDFFDAQTVLNPVFNGESIGPEGNTNWSQLDVPQINEAMSRASEATDPADRARQWGAIDKLIVAQAPGVPYVWDQQPNVRSDNVNGVLSRFNSVYDLSFTSLK